MEKKKKGKGRLSVKIQLDEPIDWGEEEICELVMQKPKAKHLKRMPSEPSMGDMLNIAGKLCGQPSAVMDDLCMTDVDKVMEALSSFF